MDLSIIIVSYNVKYFLGVCLASVHKAAEGTDCEIFVVDNNSSDGTCFMVRSEYPQVKLIANNENRGFSAANNQAISQASGRYLLLLNPDTVIGEETFRKCIRFMDEHVDAGAAGVMMINGKGRFLPESKRALPDPATAFFKISGLRYLSPRSSRFNRYYLGNLSNHETNLADVVSGAFMLLSRDAVKKTGLLDESFFMFGEDIDYSYRLLKAGYKNYYYPEIKIIHFKGESTRKEDIDYLVNFYNAMLIFVKKHYTDGSFKILALPIRIAILIRAAVSFIHRFFRRMIVPVYRIAFSLNSAGQRSKRFSKHMTTMIVSEPEGYNRVSELLYSSGKEPLSAGRISIDSEDKEEGVIGNIADIKDIIKEKKVREVIFTPGKLTYSEIIDCFSIISVKNLSLKIAYPGEKYLLGSGSVITHGKQSF